jgi:formyltetrahydrofolate-dependent phosphoribosylglycinamide formyltransferase
VSRIRVAVLASGGGTTFENLVVRSRDGRLDAEIVVLVVSRPDCGAVEKAKRLRVPCVVVPWKKDAQSAFDVAITSAVESAKADLVCLGGFLKLWTIPNQWLGSVMNIHPALLPAFGGKGMHGHHVHETVLAAGAKESGCTVHFATNEYDAGPIILQKRVPVLPGDTPDSLAARVFVAECEAYPEAIALYAAGKARLR